MINKIICVLSAVVICISLCLFVYADEGTQSSPDIIIEKFPITQEEKEKCIENLNFQVVAYDPEQYKNAWMTAVDVSQSEMIAVAYNNESIVIADKDFNVDRVFQFDSRQLSYYINWNGNNLELFFNRGDKIFTFSADGEILDVNAFDVGCEAARHASEKKRDIIKETTYELRHSNLSMKLAGTKYDNLVKIDSEGNENILFQSENTVPVKDIGFFVIYFGGLSFFMIYFGGLSFFAVLIPVAIIVPIKLRNRFTNKKD